MEDSSRPRSRRPGMPPPGSGQPAIELLVLLKHPIRSCLEINRLPSNQIPHCSRSEIGLTDVEPACCFAQGLGLLVTELDRDSHRRSPTKGLMASRLAPPFADGLQPVQRSRPGRRRIGRICGLSGGGICSCWSTQWAARAASRLSRSPWMRSMALAESAARQPDRAGPLRQRRRRQGRATNGTTAASNGTSASSGNACQSALLPSGTRSALCRVAGSEESPCGSAAAAGARSRQPSQPTPSGVERLYCC